MKLIPFFTGYRDPATGAGVAQWGPRVRPRVGIPPVRVTFMPKRDAVDWRSVRPV